MGFGAAGGGAASAAAAAAIEAGVPNIIVELAGALEGTEAADGGKPETGALPKTIVWLAARALAGGGTAAAPPPAAPNIIVVLGFGATGAGAGVGSTTLAGGLAVNTLPHRVH